MSYNEGRQARRDGMPRAANPYSGPMAKLWDDGWMDTDTILRALGAAT